MLVFTVFPVYSANSMDFFDVSVVFKCEECGRIAEDLDHQCFDIKEPVSSAVFSFRKLFESFFPGKTLDGEV